MATVLNWRRLLSMNWIAGLSISALGVPVALAQEPPDAVTVRSEVIIPAERGVETVLRGPLHEAFAEPIELEVKPTVVIRQEPPEVIEELPPEVRLADDRAEWIPGYWAWDEDRDDFLWISGIWRVPPPGRRWVPGHWIRAENGYQWISGFWASEAVEHVAYLPYPPESLEEGPNQPAPSDNYYWVSGQWMWRESRYAWSPGYWSPYQAGWAWNPSYYVWTPRGAIFVNGYWDYPFGNRGVPFAPVYFSQPVYRQVGYSYSPSVAVNVAQMALSMFVNPGYNHYYYGDYYSSNYVQRGYVPWYQYASTRNRYYDPMVAYYRTTYRLQGIDYDQRMRGWHNYYSQNPNRRPPRTFADQVRIASQPQGNQNLQYALLGAAVSELIGGGNNRNQVNSNNQVTQINQQFNQQFSRITSETRQSLRRNSNQFRNVATQRQRVEAASAAAANANADTKSDKAATRNDAQADARLQLPRAERRPNAAAAPETPDVPAQEQQATDPPTRDTAKSRDGKGRDAANARDPANVRDAGKSRDGQGRDEIPSSADAKSTDPTGTDATAKSKGKGRAPDSRGPDGNSAPTSRGRSNPSRLDNTPIIPEAPPTAGQPAADSQKGSVDKAKSAADRAEEKPASRDGKGRDQDRNDRNKGPDRNDQNKGKGKGKNADRNNSPDDSKGNSSRNRATDADRGQSAVNPDANRAPTTIPGTPKLDREQPSVTPDSNRAPAAVPVVPNASPVPKADREQRSVNPDAGRAPTGIPRASDLDRNPVIPREPQGNVRRPATTGNEPRTTTERPAVPNIPDRTTRKRVDPDIASPPRSSAASDAVPPTARDGRRGRDADAALPPVIPGEGRSTPRSLPADVQPDRSGRGGVGRSSPSSADRSSAQPMNRGNRETRGDLPAPAPKAVTPTPAPTPAPAAPPTARSAQPPASKPAPNVDRGKNAAPPAGDNSKAKSNNENKRQGKGKGKDKDDS